jgi:hypothetical protein
MPASKLATLSGPALLKIQQQSVNAVRPLFVRKVPFLGKGVAAARLRKTSLGAAFSSFIP